jgi:hypothetical protein
MPPRKRTEVDELSVFLNVPFDSEYSPLFVALIAGLTALGRTPRSVLEIQEGGQNRLSKIFSLISLCGSSIHDLSRVLLSGDLQVPRFNMPFELGLAVAVAQKRRHAFFLLEEKPFRIQASLSDLNGHDPHVHQGTQAGILRCILDCFATPSGTPPPATLERLTMQLSAAANKFQSELRTDHPFQPHLFRRITWAASEFARIEGLIA